MLEALYLSGKSKTQTLFQIAIPNIKPLLLRVIIIAFAHTIGEFGIVLMIGRSIPNETIVVSVVIYEFVEILDFSLAHIYSFIMLLISFLVLFSIYFTNKRQKK